MKPERIFAEYKTSSLTENLCLLIEGENGFTEDENLRLEYTFSDGRLKAWATPVSQNESVILSCFMVSGKVETPSTKDTRYFLNGFQSWTDTQELSADEKETTISHLPKFVKNKFALDSYGDYNFCRQNLPKGQFHGWTYAYVRNRDTFEFAGSLTELKAACEGELSSKSFGLFFINAKTNTFELYSDSEIINYKVSGKTLMSDCLFVTGSEDEVFDSYFSTAKIEKPNVKPVLGWTSWYNFYEKINSSILIEQIEHIENYNRNNQDKKLEIFQIDDGYQMAVGDWLFVDKEKFPEGLEPVITKAKNSGLVPGIWWAPFSAAKSSRLAKEHPDWLLKNEKGKDVCCGSNWGGFYGLDIYNEEVRAYIKKVCRHFIDNLGIGLFKVDFLYSAIITERKDKTRGQVMQDAMTFFREVSHGAKILGCGVPLGSAFGNVDYCRIGCDVSLSWDDNIFARMAHRERPSTKHTILNSIYRRQLNGRAFLNDPDVFILRSYNEKLGKERKSLLTKVNCLTGGLVFTSDNPNLMDEWQKETLNKALELRGAKITKVENDSGVVTITYNGEEKQMSGEIKFYQ